MKYELGSYIPDDGILHSHCRENLKSYINSLCWRRISVKLSGSAVVSCNYLEGLRKSTNMTQNIGHCGPDSNRGVAEQKRRAWPPDQPVTGNEHGGMLGAPGQ
jgi:hypothetical protein